MHFTIPYCTVYTYVSHILLYTHNLYTHALIYHTIPIIVYIYTYVLHHLSDLAGSENAKMTNSVGERAKEAKVRLYYALYVHLYYSDTLHVYM